MWLSTSNFRQPRSTGQAASPRTHWVPLSVLQLLAFISAAPKAQHPPPPRTQCDEQMQRGNLPAHPLPLLVNPLARNCMSGPIQNPGRSQLSCLADYFYPPNQYSHCSVVLWVGRGALYILFPLRSGCFHSEQMKTAPELLLS